MKLLSLSSLLTVGRQADHPIAVRNGEAIDFDRFHSDVAIAVMRFKSYRSGALVCQDSYNFAVGFYGLLHAGAEIIFPSNAQPATLQSLHEEFDLLVDDAAIEDIQGDHAILASLDPTKLALNFFTSGSTGAPKRITKNLAMLENEVAVLDSLWGQKMGQGLVFATVSHQHIYGLTFKLLWPLASGRPFTASTYPLWENLMAEITPGAVIVSSPAHLERLSGLPPLPSHRRPQQIFSAGSLLSPAASQKAESRCGWYATEFFGSTETGAIATRSLSGNDVPWKLLPGIEMRCDDEGHLTLRSPFVGPEWITTADLIDPVAGGFHFRGRADRIAKIEGKRVSLTEIEQTLGQLSMIKGAAIALLPGERDRLVAVVVPSEEGQVTLSKLGSFRFGRILRNALALKHEAAGIPRLWRFVDELPAQGMGKRRDVDILALFNEGT